MSQTLMLFKFDCCALLQLSYAYEIIFFNDPSEAEVNLLTYWKSMTIAYSNLI